MVLKLVLFSGLQVVKRNKDVIPFLLRVLR